MTSRFLFPCSVGNNINFATALFRSHAFSLRLTPFSFTTTPFSYHYQTCTFIAFAIVPTRFLHSLPPFLPFSWDHLSSSLLHPPPFFHLSFHFMLRNTMTDNRLTLFCLVDGEATSNAFSIKIPSSDTVDELKDLIKIKNPDTFSRVDAKELTLWRVSILDDDNGEEDFPILLDNISGKDRKKLRATSELSDVFEETPPKKTIHIIVQRPPQGNVNPLTLIPLFHFSSLNSHASLLQHSSYSYPRSSLDSNTRLSFG